MNHHQTYRNLKAGCEMNLMVQRLAPALLLSVRRNTMNYTTVITTVEQLGTISNYVKNQLECHLQSWSAEIPGAACSIQWIKNSLVLKTNCSTVLDKWLKIERQYLAYVLDESQFVFKKSPMSIAA
jgi:hypothetical protein